MILDYALAVFAGIVGSMLICYFEQHWHRKNEPFRPGTRVVVLSIILAAFFVALIVLYEPGTQRFVYAALALILAAIILTDIDTSTIPNPLIIAGILLWVGAVLLLTIELLFFQTASILTLFSEAAWYSLLVDGVIGAGVVGGGVLLCSVLYEQVSKKPSIGGGDIKLIFMVGLYLGLTGSLVNLFLACVFGLIFAAVWRNRRRSTVSSEAESETKSETKIFPFGPAISVATLLTLLVMPLL